jgi:hypothetical protein
METLGTAYANISAEVSVRRFFWGAIARRQE